MTRYNGSMMFNPDDPKEIARSKEIQQRARRHLENENLEERLAIQEAEGVQAHEAPLAKEIPPAAKQMIERFKKELEEKRVADLQDADKKGKWRK